MNKNNTVRKIVDFERDPEFYMNRAYKLMDGGDYFSALQNMRRAIKSRPTELNYRLTLARTFYEMELYEYAADEYFKILAGPRRERDTECCLGLVSAFMMSDNFGAAHHYLRRAYELQKNDIEGFLDGMDEDDFYTAELYELIDELERRVAEARRPRFVIAYDKNADYRNLVRSCSKLMRREYYDKALDTLKYVPDTSDSYLEAQNNMAICEYAMGRYKRAAARNERAMRIDPDDVFALCNRLMITRKLKKTREFKAVLSQIDKIKDDDLSDADLYRLAMTMCELDLHGRAVKYFDIILSEGCDDEIMLLSALAHFNDGRPAEARRILFDLLSVNPHDATAEYYAALFHGDRRKRRVEYGYQLPRSEVVSRLKSLERADAMTPAALDARLKENPADLELFRWAPTLDVPRLTEAVFGRLAESGNYDGALLANELLLSGGVSGYQKKYILKSILSGKTSARVNVTSGGILRVARYVLPAAAKNFPKSFTEAYINSFCTLALICEDFETRLAACFKAMLKIAAPIAEKLKNAPAIAAVLSYRYGGREMFGDRAALCEYHGAGPAVFRTYYKLLKGEGGESNENVR